MEFSSTVAHSAALIKSAWGEDSLQAAAIVRTTFRVLPNGELEEAPDEHWPITPGADNETPAGVFPGDTAFLLGGVDVWVVGTAIAPKGEPVERMTVTLRIGPRFSRSVLVIGDRRWTVRDGLSLDDESAELIASDPVRFTRMPMSYARAFGGKAIFEETEHIWPANPAGVGFYMTRELALGGALPNLETPAALIKRWDDRPDPACLAPYPVGGSLRAERALEMDESDPAMPVPARITPIMLNGAHPDLVIPAQQTPPPGTEVRIDGVRENGPLVFALPQLRYHACVQLETKPVLLPLVLDGIGVMTEGPVDRLPRLVLSHRVVFRYRVKKGERRMTTLYQGAKPAAMPDSYITDWDAEAAEAATAAGESA